MGVPVQYLEFPTDLTEYEIQYAAHKVLEMARYTVRGELPMRNRAGGRNCRFDLVVFDSAYTELLCIVECKREDAPVEDQQVGRYQYQFEKVPVVVIRGLSQAMNAATIVAEAIKAPVAVSKGSKIAAKEGIYKKPDYR